MLLRAARREQDEAVDTPGLEIAGDPTRLVGEGLNQQQVIGVGVQAGRQAAQDLEHEVVRHRLARRVGIRNERDDVALAPAETSRRIVHLEPVLLSDGADALPRTDADERAVVERARDGRLRYPGEASDVGDRSDAGRFHGTGCSIRSSLLVCNRLQRSIG